MVNVIGQWKQGICRKPATCCKSLTNFSVRPLYFCCFIMVNVCRCQLCRFSVCRDIYVFFHNKLEILALPISKQEMPEMVNFLLSYRAVTRQLALGRNHFSQVKWWYSLNALAEKWNSNYHTIVAMTWQPLQSVIETIMSKYSKKKWH